MKLIVNISDEEYSALQSASYYSFDKYTAYLAMKNGTPLPKHHGDLIDRDTIEVLRIGNIKREYDKGFDAGVTCMVNRILDAPIIIEGSESE